MGNSARWVKAPIATKGRGHLFYALQSMVQSGSVSPVDREEGVTPSDTIIACPDSTPAPWP